jgi:hypothetical protein
MSYNDGTFTLPAGATAIPQGALVTWSGSAIGLNTADNVGYIGVAVEAATAYGDVAICRCNVGLREVLAGGTVAAGDLLALAANGRVVEVTNEAYVCGQAVTGGASGDLVTAFLLDTPITVAS